MREFRQRTKAIIAKIHQGQHLILTYRGKPVVRLEPIKDGDTSADDPFYSLHLIATSQPETGRSKLEAIDETVYGI